MYGYHQFAVSVLEPPTEEPVTVAEARLNSRIDSSHEDSLLALWIQSAREWVERETRRVLCTTSLRLTLDRFPCGRRLLLPGAPLRTVEQIAYDDPAGDEQIVDAATYRVDPAAAPGRVVLRADSTLWPSTACDAGAVRIDYTAGYGGRADVPASLRAAILLVVGDLYERREAQLDATPAPNPAVTRLIDKYRLVEFA